MAASSEFSQSKIGSTKNMPKGTAGTASKASTSGMLHQPILYFVHCTMYPTYNMRKNFIHAKMGIGARRIQVAPTTITKVSYGCVTIISKIGIMFV